MTKVIHRVLKLSYLKAHAPFLYYNISMILLAKTDGFLTKNRRKKGEKLV
ncbi:hypothetical protein B0H39_004644 [Clostridium beijerinckii]|nr:hypothetical protein [Clostridium beijerinckii]NOW86763.1 hypothetical protein [Clostridium beijerinckii]